MENQDQMENNDIGTMPTVSYWKKKPKKITTLIIEVEKSPDDTEDSLRNFCSQFGEVREIISVPYSERECAVIAFCTPEALIKALKHPISEELDPPGGDRTDRLDINSWVSLIPQQKQVLLEEELKVSQFKRRSVYSIFMASTDALNVCKVIVNDVRKFAEKVYTRIPTEPVIDFIDLLMTTQKSRAVDDKNSIVDAENASRIFYGELPVPLRLPIPVSEFQLHKQVGMQPMILCTQVKCSPDAEADIFGCHSCTPTETYSSSHDNICSDYVEAKNMRYTMAITGAPWTTAARQSLSDEDANDSYENSERPPDAKKRRTNRSLSDDLETTSRKSSPKIGASSSDISDKIAYQLGQTTFYDLTDYSFTRVVSDKLHVDVLIVCSDLLLCRYLSAMFGIIHIDEILLHFHNRKLESAKKITFTTPAIKSTICSWWDEITSNKFEHRTCRMVQTRYCEYLAIGCHNVAVTCCKAVTKNTIANFYTYMGKENEILLLNVDIYHFASEIDSKNLLISGIKGLSLLMDRVLGRTVRVPFVLRHKNKYYKMEVSAICIIPFYILRSLAERGIRDIHRNPQCLF